MIETIMKINAYKLIKIFEHYSVMIGTNLLVKTLSLKNKQTLRQ